MTEFKENYNLYKDFTEKYKEGARKIFPTGLFQDDKYIGHEGLCEVQKKENEQKLKKFSSYFKENEYPQQYWEDQSKVVALNALKNTSLGFTISRDPLRAASNFVSNLYNISTFRPPDNVSGDLAKIDESYKELYVNLFWNKLTRVYLHTPSSLMYTGYGKMNNFFKIADSVRDHFLRKGQKLNQLVDYPKVQQTADDSDFKTFEGSKVQQTANNSNFKVFEDFTWGGIADVDDFDIFENPKVDSMQHNSYSILKLPKANIILDRNTWKLTDIHRSHKSTSFSWTISNIEEGKIKVIVYKSNTAGYEYNIYFHNGKNKAINTITKIKCLKILSHHYGCGVAVAYK